MEMTYDEGERGREPVDFSPTPMKFDSSYVGKMSGLTIKVKYYII